MFEMLCLLKKLHNKKFPVNFPVMREGSIDSSDKNGVTKVFFLTYSRKTEISV